MGNPAAFSPLGNALTLLAPNNSATASTTLPGQGGGSLKIVNEAAVAITVAVSTVAGGAVPTVNNFTVNAGISELMSLPFNTVDVAVFGVGGTGNVVVQRGDGI